MARLILRGPKKLQTEPTKPIPTVSPTPVKKTPAPTPKKPTAVFRSIFQMKKTPVATSTVPTLSDRLKQMASNVKPAAPVKKVTGKTRTTAIRKTKKTAAVAKKK